MSLYYRLPLNDSVYPSLPRYFADIATRRALETVTDSPSYRFPRRHGILPPSARIDLSESLCQLVECIKHGGPPISETPKRGRLAKSIFPPMGFKDSFDEDDDLIENPLIRKALSRKLRDSRPTTILLNKTLQGR